MYSAKYLWPNHIAHLTKVLCYDYSMVTIPMTLALSDRYTPFYPFKSLFLKLHYLEGWPWIPGKQLFLSLRRSTGWPKKFDTIFFCTP